MKASESHAKRLLELQKLLFEFAEVERYIYFPDGKKKDRLENDVEHSYNLAMAAWFLCKHFPALDRDKLIRYALIHDFVEVHAGDVMAIGRTPEAEQAKRVREEAALKKIEAEWPDFADMTELIRSYEERTDPESKFIYALDKLMPMILNMLSNGKTWKLYKMARQDVLQAKDSQLPISPEVNELWQVYRAQIIENPELFAHDKDAK